jgi:outer membrane biosynthesis protein TonB
MRQFVPKLSAWLAMLTLVLSCGGTSAAPPPETPAGGGAETAEPVEPPMPRISDPGLDPALVRAPIADLRTTGPSAVGGRTRDALRGVMEALETRIRYCFQLAQREGLTPSGTVSVQLAVGPDGTVKAAEVIENQTGIETFGECVLSIARRAVFPAAEVPVGVIYPFALQGGQ